MNAIKTKTLNEIMAESGLKGDFMLMGHSQGSRWYFAISGRTAVVRRATADRIDGWFEFRDIMPDGRIGFKLRHGLTPSDY